MSEKPPSDNAAGALLLAAINLDEIPEPTIASVDDRTHVQASQTWTACGRSVHAARLADVGQTVSCPECIKWLEEEDDEKTPARGTPAPVSIELALDVEPQLQLSMLVTLPDGKRYGTTVPQSVLDAMQSMRSVEDPRRVSWTLTAQAQSEPSEG